MYLTPHRHALGTTMNKRQESRKKNKPERGRPTELHRAIHPNRERGRRPLTVQPWNEEAGGAGQRQGISAHANDGHRESQKGHGGHQENIHLSETGGNLRLGFPVKCQTLRRGSWGIRPQDPGRTEDGGESQDFC